MTLCRHCGGALQVQNRVNQLPPMTILDGRYLVGVVLGEGGFGITYAGYDLRLQERVAIKEYYPSGLGTRISSHSLRVESSGANAADAMARGREKFLEEARTMTRFKRLPSIVEIQDFFQANGTAYIVMEYLDGVSMSAWLKRHGPEQNFNRLYAMLAPVLRDLEKIHQAGLIHRDISPSNLMLLEDGTVKLLDFGTARDMSEEGEKSLSVVLKHGFAPAEQYSRRGQQGAWTDIYALCATIYKLLTGLTPDAAMDRQEEDSLQPPSQLGVSISKTQEQTLLRGLAVRRSERIQTLAELMAGFEGKAAAAPAVSAPSSAPAPHRDTPSTEEKKPKKGLVLGLCALAVVVAAVFVAIQVIVPNMKYKDAVALMESGSYTEAIAVFETLDGYKDSAEKLHKLQMTEKMQAAKVGDLVTFGTYEQDNDTANGAEAIQWRVLAKEEDRILVISEYALEARPYNNESTNTTWENCTLRDWLNEEFYNTAFTSEEQTMIPMTTVKARKNPNYNTDPGKDTQDKIFLLSIQEARAYFPSNEVMLCAPTAYAKAKGAWISENTKTVNGEAACWWWLRSPGMYQYRAAYVFVGGGVLESGYSVDYFNVCVRPALWIDLDA